MDWNVGQTVREVFRLNERMDRVLHGHCVDPGLVVLDNEHHHPLTHLVSDQESIIRVSKSRFRLGESKQG